MGTYTARACTLCGVYTVVVYVHCLRIYILCEGLSESSKSNQEILALSKQAIK
jgi:hypothetical protein